MGLFKKIKEKLFGKSVAQSEKYVVGLEKSRKNFQDKFKELVARYRNVDDSYFDEVEEILIGADIGGIPELVKHNKNGLIYKYDDIDDLAIKMKKLFDDEKLVKKFGQQAKEIAKVQYSKEKYYDEIFIIKVY